MRTTTLSCNGPEVGVIGLGCMGMTYSYDMATPRDDDTSISVIHQALDLGVTLIDTADAYVECLVQIVWRTGQDERVHQRNVGTQVCTLVLDQRLGGAAVGAA